MQASKLREALKNVREVAVEMARGYATEEAYDKMVIDGWAERLSDIVDAALSEPVCNCDAGTATDKEKDVITWAFNLARSVTAGDYGLPRPMNMAINGLQDAVHALASERGIGISDGCSKEFLEKEAEPQVAPGGRARVHGQGGVRPQDGGEQRRH